MKMKMKNLNLKIFLTLMSLAFLLIPIFSLGKTAKTLGKIKVVLQEEKQAPTDEEKQIQQELLKLIPGNSDIKGWKQKSPPRFFNAENLWQYIDGAAEHFIIYGFKHIAGVEYQRVEQPDITLTLDIYDMGNISQAFGVYSTERPPDTEFISIGTQCFSDDLSTTFFKGRYFVKIFVFNVSADLKEGMKNFANFVSGKIPGEAIFPPELNKLPKENKIPNSEQFIAKGILGENDLKNGFTALYKFENSQPNSSLFFLTTESEKDAEQAYSNIKSGHEKNLDPMREINGFGKKCLDVLTKYNGRVVIMIDGKKVAGGWFLPKDDLVSLKRIKQLLE